jgi:Glycosyl transferase family 11
MIIITTKFGQLANRLILFAHFIAFAAEHNLTIINPAFDEYAQFFESTCNDPLCQFPATSRKFFSHPNLRKAIHATFRAIGLAVHKAKISNSIFGTIRLSEEQELDLSSCEFLDFVTQKKIVLARGWLFRDRANWNKHADKIRTYFTPIAIHRSQVQALISRIRPTCQTLVGVHIRQGDYAEFMDGKYFYSVDQYIQVMGKVKALFPDREVAFLICSNVPQKLEDFSSFNVTFATQHLVEDLYALAQCDYLIGTLSTYTLWASFYGEVPLYTIQDVDRPIAKSDFSGVFYSSNQPNSCPTVR